MRFELMVEISRPYRNVSAYIQINFSLFKNSTMKFRFQIAFSYNLWDFKCHILLYVIYL